MTKRQTSRSRRGQPSSQQNVTLLVLGVVAIFALLFLITGVDPLGLFPTAEPTPVVSGGDGSDWWEVYFTDPARINNPDVLAGSIPEQLIANIEAAQQSIHIAAFEFDLTPVAEALIAAQRRGVEVRWVTDDEYGLFVDEEEDRGQFAMLKKAGIPVRSDERGALMHDKFWIFDGQVVWTGSTNITRNDNFRNNNNVIVIRSPALAVIYEREFAEMWAGEFGPKSPSTVTQQRLTIEGTPIQVYFASEDEAISHLIPLVAQATESIYFMAFSFTHDGLSQAVLEQAQAGVTVQGIFETRGSETEFSALYPLYCERVPVRQDGNPGTFHHKVFILDRKTVVTGSLNFSNNADESNDENVLVITSPDIANLYLQEFDRRWKEASPPDSGEADCK